METTLNETDNTPESVEEAENETIEGEVIEEPADEPTGGQENTYVYGAESDILPNADEVAQTVEDSQEIEALLLQWQEEQKQYEEKVLEVQTYISDQTQNIVSIFLLLVLAVGFLSGIVLARTVWRKF